MARFSEKSLERLKTCHPDLQILFKSVVEKYDCSILEGHRGQQRQDDLLAEGRTKVEFPNSKHNSLPSMAVDVAPYPVDWNTKERFYHFAGYVLAVARTMGIKIRWGGDWDGDLTFKDQTFHDLPHFELIG